MCNSARLSSEPETLHTTFRADWPAAPPNRWPVELTPKGRAPVIRAEVGKRVIDVMGWDVLGGQAS